MTAPGLQITWAHSRSAQLSHAKAHHMHPTLHWGLSPRPAQSSWTPVACRGLKDTLEKKVWKQERVGVTQPSSAASTQVIKHHFWTRLKGKAFYLHLQDPGYPVSSICILSP